jgi:hypothetical protein
VRNPLSAQTTRRGVTKGVAVCGGALLALMVAASPAGALKPPSLRITPGPYSAGQMISISVGPNHYFKPYSRINLLECADAGGKPQNLPRNENTCDGNTVQGDTILVGSNGSFSEKMYKLYALPNASQLGESADTRPKCDQKNACVLYVGENQSNFTWPKEFSHPFTLGSSRKHG